jgi:hypothetical protein
MLCDLRASCLVVSKWNYLVHLDPEMGNKQILQRSKDEDVCNYKSGGDAAISDSLCLCGLVARFSQK